jgi:DNA-binding XRE family transcriptional regulator
MSRWERDLVYPTWPNQSRVIEYLGYDPFTQPELGSPRGNETQPVAVLSSDGPDSFGSTVRKRRLELRKNRKEFAQILGVDTKTIGHWEANRHKPLPALRERLLVILGHS